MKTLKAITTVMEYIVESEMEGKYDPDDSYSGTYNVLKDLRDKIIEEQYVASIRWNKGADEVWTYRKNR